MYDYYFGDIPMGKYVSLGQVTYYLAALTGYSHEFIAQEVRNMEIGGEVILLGEGGSIARVVLSDKS